MQEYLRTTSADFVFGQEMRVEGASCADHEDSLRHDGWKVAIQPCVHGMKGGASAGTAIACRKHIGVRGGVETAKEWGELEGRFQVKKIGAICKDSHN